MAGYSSGRAPTANFKPGDDVEYTVLTKIVKMNSDGTVELAVRPGESVGIDKVRRPTEVQFIKLGEIPMAEDLSTGAAFGIIVQPLGTDSIELQVKGEDTVARLKQRLEESIGLSPIQMRLVKANKQLLDDTASLGSFNIKEGTTLTLIKTTACLTLNIISEPRIKGVVDAFVFIRDMHVGLRSPDAIIEELWKGQLVVEEGATAHEMAIELNQDKYDKYMSAMEQPSMYFSVSPSGRWCPGDRMDMESEKLNPKVTFGDIVDVVIHEYVYGDLCIMSAVVSSKR